MTAYTEFVKEWAKRNGVSYMCAIGKQGLKDEYQKSKQIVNKKGRAIQAVNSYNEQGGFRPRAKRTRKPKVPELKRRVTRELPPEPVLAPVLEQRPKVIIKGKKKDNGVRVTEKKETPRFILPPEFYREAEEEDERLERLNMAKEDKKKVKKRTTKIIVKSSNAIQARRAKEARNREDMGKEDKNMAKKKQTNLAKFKELRQKAKDITGK